MMAIRILYRIRQAEMRCPRCGRFHVDREEWAHKPHHTHLCEHCDYEFEIGSGAVYYAGIPPVSIKGRLRALVHDAEDALAYVIVALLKH